MSRLLPVADCSSCMLLKTKNDDDELKIHLKQLSFPWKRWIQQKSWDLVTTNAVNVTVNNGGDQSITWPLYFQYQLLCFFL